MATDIGIAPAATTTASDGPTNSNASASAAAAAAIGSGPNAFPPHSGTPNPGSLHAYRLADTTPVNLSVSPNGPSKARKRKTPPDADVHAPGRASPAPPAPAPAPAGNTPAGGSGGPGGQGHSSSQVQGHQSPAQAQMPPHLPPSQLALHVPPGMPPPLPAYAYAAAPADFSPGGVPPPHGQASMVGAANGDPGSADDAMALDASRASSMRQLSTSKRAEQNRKAQRAFRERRDQHVKNLEQRSALLDTALASADEANRRWEECRAVVDALRIENAQLRAEVAGLRAENQSLHGALAQGGLAPPHVIDGAKELHKDKDAEPK